MEYQDYLIGILFILVVILSILLIRRIIFEKRQMAAIRNMGIPEFSEFLLNNSMTGVIGEVAHKVSELLKNSFGCEKVVFLRKRKDSLEMNYQHGLEGYNRNLFKFKSSPKLAKIIETDFMPREVTELDKYLPENFVTLIKKYKLELFFPIFWRDNLYGVYFISSNIEAKSPAFKLMVASLAQSLSAAYHVKWHEAKSERLQKKLESMDSRSSKSRVNSESSMLKLILHRNPETIVPKLIDSISEDLGMKRVAFLYNRKSENNNSVRLIQSGKGNKLKFPEGDELNSMLEILDDLGPQALKELKIENTELNSWVEMIKSNGYDYIMPFSPSSEYPGVLAWSYITPTGKPPEDIKTVLKHAVDLLDNAEAFERVEELSFTDNLTGLANQRYFERRINEEIQRAGRYKRKMALIIFDLDELKGVNDNYGHLAGDEILKQMGSILRGTIRTIDIIARYGGDEFCIIMPEADDITCAKFMQRLKNDVASSSFNIPGIDNPLKCTISLGGAIFPDHAGSPKELIHSADMALLLAKESGRNKSILFSPSIN